MAEPVPWSVRLRAWLRPLRPVLRPIWHRVGPLLRGESRWSPRVVIDRVEGRLEERRVPRAQRRAIRPMRYWELVELASRVPYYRPRVGYMHVAGDIATDLIARMDLRTALELGPNLRSLIVGADVMELVDRKEMVAEGRKLIHDATVAPWPVDDKAYGLFVALQVFEHLGTGQAAAFREVRRVARNAILSLPIDWVMDDPRNAHHLLSNDTVLSWFAPLAPTRIVVGNPGRRKRLIYVFEDLPAPAPETEAAPAAETPAPGSGSAAV